MNTRDMFHPRKIDKVDIFILYLKNNHIITMDKDNIIPDSATSSISPATISRITASHCMVDGTRYTLDEVISYNNTYHLNRQPDVADVICIHDGLSPIIFNPSSRMLASLNCLIIIMKCIPDRVKPVRDKTRKKYLNVVK